MLKKPWICAAWRSTKRARLAPAVTRRSATSFAGDGDAGTVFAVLARVAVVGNDGGDAACGGAAERVLHDEQLHEVLVGGIAGGLDEEDVGAADVFEQLEVDFAVREALELGFAERHAEELADLFRERAVGGAGEDLEALVFGELRGLACGGCRGRRRF